MTTDDDYDYCRECTGYGDDYHVYVDEDGELQCACDNCPLNPVWRDDD